MRSALSIVETAERLGVSSDLLYRMYDPETSAIDVGWTQMRVLTIGQRKVVPVAEVERVLCEPAS